MGQTDAASEPAGRQEEIDQSPSDKDDHELRDHIQDLSFGVNKSRRYHEFLCSFYTRWRDAMKVVTVISGSGAFFLITQGHKELAELVSAFVATWAILDVIFAPDKKADLHRELGQRFIDLARDIATAPHDRHSYQKLSARRLELEKDEPPCKRLVDLQARNDECRARGFPPECEVPLSRAQRRFGYFLTFGMARLE